MSFSIIDGTGDSKVARVDANKRLHTQAVTSPTNEQATQKGNSFNINTGLVTLGTANETPILYLKNNEDAGFHVISIIVGFQTSTDGVGNDASWKVVKDPDAGTVISSPVTAPMISNRNFGSSAVLDADVFIGADGKGLTGGTDHIQVIQNDGGTRVAIPIDELLPKGHAIGILITPPASNSSMVVYCAIVGHIEDPGNI